jgi:hypothetical protein
MLKIHSYFLPYFFEKEVSIFLLDGREIRVPLSQFQDVTTEGGRFHQFYTFLIGGDEYVQPKDKGGFDSGNIPGSEGIGIKNDHLR